MNGLVLLFNMDQLSWAHAKNINPFIAKRLTGILQVTCYILTLLLIAVSTVLAAISTSCYCTSYY